MKSLFGNMKAQGRARGEVWISAAPAGPGSRGRPSRASSSATRKPRRIVAGVGRGWVPPQRRREGGWGGLWGAGPERATPCRPGRHGRGFARAVGVRVRSRLAAPRDGGPACALSRQRTLDPERACDSSLLRAPTQRAFARREASARRAAARAATAGTRRDRHEGHDRSKRSYGERSAS